MNQTHEQNGSLTEINKLQVQLILQCTDLDPETRITIYAERFRAIFNEDPSLTEFQVKHALYYKKYAHET